MRHFFQDDMYPFNNVLFLYASHYLMISRRNITYVVRFYPRTTVYIYYCFSKLKQQKIDVSVHKECRK